MATNSDLTNAQEAALRKAMSDIQPRWAQDGLGVRGNERQIISQTTRTQWPDPVVNYKQAERPSVTTPIVFPKPVVASGSSQSFPFHVADASDDTGLKVSVKDGKVNDQYPSGMGSNDYVLEIEEETFQEVLLVATFNRETLELTSIFLDVTDDPASYTDDYVEKPIVIPIADIIITYDADSNPIVTVYQKQLGDISFQLVYGALSGAPALYASHIYGEPVPLYDDE